MAAGLSCFQFIGLVWVDGSVSWERFLFRRARELINTTLVEEELAAAQPKASNKDEASVRLDHGRAARSLAAYVGVLKR